MTKRMLIDASHAEETRVVVLDGNRLEDFDVETATKRQLKGNIYLAKVVRVEPSLQAAFVEYGGNRHGFLAFDEIHPDYYQIPVADRQRLLDLQAEQAREEEEAADRDAERHSSADNIPHASDGGDESDGQEVASDREPGDGSTPPDQDISAQPLAIEAERIADGDDAGGGETGGNETGHQPISPELAQEAGIPADLSVPVVAESVDESGGTAELLVESATEDAEAAQGEATDQPEPPTDAHDELERQLDGERTEAGDPDGDGNGVGYEQDDHIADSPPPETIGGENDTGDDTSERRIPFRFLRNYKIQEVIRRRQILLVQVVKEERGTKGAALTTYVSLAGRYCVLMPNSPRGGGISRKITSPADRRRLKEVMAELDLPDGMGLIVRTAGANRPKPEIKRDCEYLLRLWDDIREHTMRSVAPALIYEEASLIKRAIRDVYSRDIDEVVVDGEDGWRAARDFMRMLMPSHVKKVQLWRDPSGSSNGGGQPLLTRYQVDAQLDAILSPTVQLRSGGYLVINQTEALVAIDVNSGRSTRERGIEETALRTNTEAADEVARQLRLRDLAGLIVIDFIDMESKKHNGMVERRLKEALKADRARIQVGYISHFGLLEMSRQRLRPSLAETSFITCPHCGGTGHVRSTESAAIHVLRGIEEEGAKRRAAEIVVHTAAAIALYILNHKREHLAEIEARSGMRVNFTADETMVSPQFRIERVRAQTAAERPVAITAGPAHVALPESDEVESAASQETEEPQPPAAEAESEPVADTNRMQAAVPAESTPSGNGNGNGADGATTEENDRFRRKRRRRRRGGRRDEGATETADEAETAVEQEPAVTHVEGAPETATPDVAEDEAQRRRGRRGRRRRRGVDLPQVAEPGAEQPDLPTVYVGPTPADPYGGHAFDIFDVMEDADLSFSNPAPEGPTVTGPPVGESVPDIEPEPSLASGPLPLFEPPEPAPEPVAEPTAEPADMAQRVPANDAEPGAPAIAPIVIGADEPPAIEKKRGWWRR